VLARTAPAAAAALLLLAAASWLPARAAERAAPAASDLARPALPAPELLSRRPARPSAAVASFLWAVAAAVAGNPASSAGGAPADAVAAPFALAYDFLAPGWRAQLTFAAFGERWAAVRRLEPLAVLAAGPVPGAPRSARVFAEARLLVAPPETPGRVFLQFVQGFYLVSATAEGWRLEAGSLQPESFAAGGGEAGAQAAAEAAARAEARRLGRAGAEGAAAVIVTARPDHQALATVRLGGEAYTVGLYECVDGAWIALSAQR